MGYKYKILFDNGKPYEIFCNNKTELKEQLKDFYIRNKDLGFIYSAYIFDSENNEITEAQFIEEMVGEVLEVVNYDYCFM